MNASSSARASRTPIVVAIPAYNEADWIVRCLTALDCQLDCPAYSVVLLVNNSTDATGPIARALQPALSYALEIVEHQFPPTQRTAGEARRMVMERAASQAPEDGILLCTDADGQVAPDWLAANLFHVRAGADAVAGRAIIDPVEAAAIPAVLHEDDARECGYAALLDEIDSRLDPDPADPWPRHTEHSGASICVTLDAFCRAGGVPPLPVGEDRAFFAALRRIDARLRHAPDVQVTVSGRIHGRAAGGMADTIRRRLVAPDHFLDDALEPAAHRARRARIRHKIRRIFAGHGRVTARLLQESGCGAKLLHAVLDQATFGIAWEMLEANAANLARIQVPVSALAHEVEQATRILSTLRARRLVTAKRGTSRPDLGGLVTNRRPETFRMVG